MKLILNWKMYLTRLRAPLLTIDQPDFFARVVSAAPTFLADGEATRALEHA